MRHLDYISLIHKELTREISLAESKDLSTWLESHEENMETYNDVKSVWDATSEFIPTFIPNVNNAFLNQMERINKETERIQPKIIRMKPYSWVASIAASLIILVSASVIWNSSQNEILSATSEKTEFALSDGSKIWLNKGSQLELKKGFGESNRTVILKGEAYFDVSKNENLSFNIEAGDLNVKVIGTAFNIRNYENNLATVMVERGKVNVASSVSNQNMDLLPGDYLKLNDTGFLIKSEVLDKNELSWKDGIISFDYVPLIEVVEDLSSYYNRKIILNNDIDNSCLLYTPEQTNISFEDMMKLLSISLNLKWEEKDNGDILFESVDC